MSEYRLLKRSFWESDYVQDQLDPSGRLIYLYLITCPKSNMEGLYKCSLRRISEETVQDREKVRQILERLERDNYAGYRDGWVCVCQATKHMSRSPKVKAHARKVYSDVPPEILLWAQSIGYRYHMDMVSHIHTNIPTDNLSPPEAGLDSDSTENVDFPTMPWESGSPAFGGGRPDSEN